MSPNIHHLDSYQHCSERESLSVAGDSLPVVDIGVGLGGGYGTGAVASSSPFDRLKRRSKYQPALALILIAVILLGIGWLKHQAPKKHQAGGATSHIPDLIWSDEFDGSSVDLSKWTFVNGNGCDVGLCGWGNNELEWYTPANAQVSGGKLVIEARKLSSPGGAAPTYTSSKIISRGKADFGVVPSKAGGGDASLEVSRRFESRMKLPWGSGIWPAFWMLPTYDTFGGWPKSGEIDIMESIGKEGNTVHGTVHYGLDWPQHQYSEAGITLSESLAWPSDRPFGNLNETYHSYAVERLPGMIRWYIDDILYSTITKDDVAPYRWSFDDEFYIIYNVAIGGNWPGNPLKEDTDDGPATVFPQALEVDYLRIYEGIFPRIAGKSVVDCSEMHVVYDVVNVEVREGASYTWTVPRSATIVEGQGTSRIIVNFDSKMIDGSIDSEVIHVRADGISTRRLSTGLAKLQETGIGMRVKVTDFSGHCPSAERKSHAKEFSFDCGRPLTCTQYVLHRTTDEFTCGERIEWLMNEKGMDESDACREVGYKQFHGHCGPCNPLA